MGKLVEKRLILFVFLILLFLAFIPTTAFFAQENANQAASTGYTEHWFGDGATVESVYSEFTSIDPRFSVLVTDQDGNSKASGLLDDGDIVAVFDGDGNLYQVFVNVNSSDSSSETSSIASSEETSQAEESSSSSQAASSQNSSVPSSSSSSVSSAVSSSVSSKSGGSSKSASNVLSGDDNDYYEFDDPVTVEELETQLAEEGVADSQLKVRTYTGSTRQSGAVCTGDILTVTNPDGTLQNRVTVIIPGDLTRCGSPNESSCKALYNYLTDSGTLQADLRRAADLNGDGSITTSDLLELKKMVAGDS